MPKHVPSLNADRCAVCGMSGMELLLSPHSECPMSLYLPKLTFIEELRALIAHEDRATRESMLPYFLSRWVEEANVNLPLGYLGKGREEARDDAARQLAEAVFSRVAVRTEHHFTGDATLRARILLVRETARTHMSEADEQALLDRIETRHYLPGETQPPKGMKRIVEL